MEFTQTKAQRKKANTKVWQKTSGTAYFGRNNHAQEALRCLKQLSLFLQKTDANVIDVESHIEIAENKLFGCAGNRV